jgi:hypothetical protein
VRLRLAAGMIEKIPHTERDGKNSARVLEKQSVLFATFEVPRKGHLPRTSGPLTNNMHPANSQSTLISPAVSGMTLVILPNTLLRGLQKRGYTSAAPYCTPHFNQ